MKCPRDPRDRSHQRCRGAPPSQRNRRREMGHPPVRKEENPGNFRGNVPDRKACGFLPQPISQSYEGSLAMRQTSAMAVQTYCCLMLNIKQTIYPAWCSVVSAVNTGATMREQQCPNDCSWCKTGGDTPKPMSFLSRFPSPEFEDCSKRGWLPVAT